MGLSLPPHIRPQNLCNIYGPSWNYVYPSIHSSPHSDVIFSCFRQGRGRPGSGIGSGGSTDPLKFKTGVKKLIPRLCRTGDFWPWPPVEKWFPRAWFPKDDGRMILKIWNILSYATEISWISLSSLSSIIITVIGIATVLYTAMSTQVYSIIQSNNRPNS